MSVITTILSAILTPLMGVLVWQLKRIVIAKNTNEKALMFLLKVNMRNYHEKYISAGYIDEEDLSEFRDMYSIYHELGGNGRGTIWMEDLEKLERR